MSISYSKCSCGAITVYLDNDDTGYSCLEKNRKKFFPSLDLRRAEKLPDTFSCNHCVNHWGLDLCACGSGEPYESCDCGIEGFCGRPMQVLGGRHFSVSDDSLCAGAPDAEGGPGEGETDAFTPLSFMECINLISSLVRIGVLHQDPEDRNNVIIYRNAGKNDPEGWYSQNIMSTAGELANSPQQQVSLFYALENIDDGVCADEGALLSLLDDISARTGFSFERSSAAGEIARQMDALREMEKAVVAELQCLSDTIVKEVGEQPFRGQWINDGKNGGPICGSVPLSAITASRGLNLSPSHYFPSKQAEAVRKKLASCKTADAICEAVRQMLEDKSVRMSKMSGDTIQLNEDTLRVLRESDLGAYALKEKEAIA